MLDSNTIAFVSIIQVILMLELQVERFKLGAKVGQDIDDLALSHFAYDGGLGKNLILQDDNTLYISSSYGDGSGSNCVYS